jgi:hypothetical protein
MASVFDEIGSLSDALSHHFRLPRPVVVQVTEHLEEIRAVPLSGPFEQIGCRNLAWHVDNNVSTCGLNFIVGSSRVGSTSPPTCPTLRLWRTSYNAGKVTFLLSASAGFDTFF